MVTDKQQQEAAERIDREARAFELAPRVYEVRQGVAGEVPAELTARDEGGACLWTLLGPVDGLPEGNPRVLLDAERGQLEVEFKTAGAVTLTWCPRA